MRFTQTVPRTSLAVGSAVALALGTATASATTVLADWDYAPLLDDWSATAVMDGSVVSRDGESLGEVHDIVFDDETGLVESITVQTRGSDLDARYRTLAWSMIEFNPELGNVTARMSADEFEGLASSDWPHLATEGELTASSLIGTSVSLDGSMPYAEIEDLLITEGANDLSAYIVETDEIAQVAEYVAIPADDEYMRMQEGVIMLPFSDMDIAGLEMWIVR